MVSELAGFESMERIAAAVAILGGFAIAWLLRPVASKGTAFGAAGAFLALGVIGLVDSFSPIPGIFLVAVIGLAWTALTFLFYRASGNNPRVAVLLSGFALLIGRIIIEISWGLIFGYVAISFAVVSSADFSRVDVSATIIGKSKFFRGLVVPFTAIDRAIGVRLSGTLKRLTLFSSYLAFELMILIGIPLMAVILSRGFLAFESVMLVVGILFSFVVGWFWRNTLRGQDSH